MKVAICNFTAAVVPGICVAAAAWLAANNHDGWGYFLLLAAITHCVYKSSPGET